MLPLRGLAPKLYDRSYEACMLETKLVAFTTVKDALRAANMTPDQVIIT